MSVTTCEDRLIKALLEDYDQKLALFVRTVLFQSALERQFFTALPTFSEFLLMINKVLPGQDTQFIHILESTIQLNGIFLNNKIILIYRSMLCSSGSMAQAARLNLRMQKEIRMLVVDPPPGVSFPLLSDKDSSLSSLSNIEARLRGPEGTVYCDGLFTLKIQIPERYPFQPPNVTFVTPIYHPNIDNGGRICLDILNLPPKGAWQPSLNISTVMMSIGVLLSEPNPDDGLMAEASREFKYNRKVFDEKARDWTKRYANPLAAANYIGNSIFPNMNMEATQPLSISMNPRSEVSTKEILSDKPEDVTEGRRKKLKLSLKSVTPFRNISSENIENIAPTGSIKEVDEKMLKENCEGVEEKSVDVRMIIVSDSEESDREIGNTDRSRFALLRKRTVPRGSD